eukprot:scaffold137859_cov22-Tisochrysis_lutea.AAC.1
MAWRTGPMIRQCTAPLCLGDYTLASAHSVLPSSFASYLLLNSLVPPPPRGLLHIVICCNALWPPIWN